MKGIPRKITNEECRLFNELAEANRGKRLSLKELYEIMSVFSNHRNLTERFINFNPSPIIIKLQKGCYKFPDSPVFIGKMQNAWEYKTPKKEIKVTKSMLEEAIDLCKENGLKVLQKDFDLDAALNNPERPVSTFIKWIEL